MKQILNRILFILAEVQLHCILFFYFICTYFERTRKNHQYLAVLNRRTNLNVWIVTNGVLRIFIRLCLFYMFILPLIFCTKYSSPDVNGINFSVDKFAMKKENNKFYNDWHIQTKSISNGKSYAIKTLIYKWRIL